MTDTKEPRWYLKLLAPGAPIGWVDPSSMYINARAFNDLLDDLAEPFALGEIDLVVATEPFGFVLGAGLAARLGVGVLSIRVDSHLAGPTDTSDFPKKSGAVGKLETRKPGFRPGTRVLMVDQWVESGGAMRGALELIKRQDAVIAGIATLCIEEGRGNEYLRETYKCSTAVLPSTSMQEQCNANKFDHFDNFDWESILPDASG